MINVRKKMTHNKYNILYAGYMVNLHETLNGIKYFIRKLNIFNSAPLPPTSRIYGYIYTYSIN